MVHASSGLCGIVSQRRKALNRKTPVFHSPLKFGLVACTVALADSSSGRCQDRSARPEVS